MILHILIISSLTNVFKSFCLNKTSVIFISSVIGIFVYTGERTKCHTIDGTHNTFLLLQKHLTSGTELILIGWKIVPNESL